MGVIILKEVIVVTLRISWRMHVICILLGIAILKCFDGFVDNILGNVFLSPLIWFPTKYVILNFYMYALILMSPIVLVHEGIHGVVFKIFGGKVKFGFKGIYAYTMETSGKPIERIKFIIVLLAPLVVITIPCLLFFNVVTGLILLLNLIGATGDIYMTIVLMGCDRNTKVIDRIYGLDLVEA